MHVDPVKSVPMLIKWYLHTKCKKKIKRNPLISSHVEQNYRSATLGFKRVEQKVNVLIEFQPF